MPCAAGIGRPEIFLTALSDTGAAGAYSCRGSEQISAQRRSIPSVGIADESRNTLRVSFLDADGQRLKRGVQLDLFAGWEHLLQLQPLRGRVDCVVRHQQAVRGANSVVTKRRIPSASFGGLENPSTAPSSGTPAGVTLNPPDGTRHCDINPIGRQPNQT